MEGVGEEVAANDLKTKGCDLPVKRDGHNILESQIMYESVRSNWLESLPHKYDAMECGDLSRRVTSLAGPEIPCTSLCSMNHTAIAAEELMVRNYSNLASVVSPNSCMQSQWKHPYPLTSGSGCDASHGDYVSQDKDQILVRVKKHLSETASDIKSLKPSSIKHIDQNPEEISAYLRARDNKIISSNTLPTQGTQLKPLSTSGFAQLFVKKTLKGKGVVCRNPENSEPVSAVVGRGGEKVDYANKIASDALLKSSVTNDQLSMHRIDKPCHEFSHDGSSLRKWLKPGHSKRDKVESLYLFRQIVEFVDFVHSQGVVLLDLRPSCFTLLPSYKIKYIGSYANRELENAVLQDLNKKRPSEQDVSASCNLGAKQQKVSENRKYLRHLSQITSSCGIRTESGNEVDFFMTGRQESGCPELQSQKHPSNQSTPTTTQRSISVPIQLEEKWYTSPEELSRRGCTFSSNIYGLGVLLFELLCYFESWEVHSAVMLNLCHRILPPNFLSENPKEAGFCLWLLHPEPSSRPTTREILQSELIRGSQELYSGDDLPISSNDNEAKSELLLNFLIPLKEQKQRLSSKLLEDIECLEEDIKEVERRHFLRTSSNFSQTNKEFLDSRKQGLQLERPISAVSRSSSLSVSNMDEPRLMRNVSQLEGAYFSLRSQFRLTEAAAEVRSDKDLLKKQVRWSEVQNENGDPSMNQMPINRLGAFFEGLCKFSRYSKFQVRGILRNGDLLNSATVICSLSFDRDEDYIAAAGVSKRIKIFEFNALMSDSADIHYPVVEMTNKSKLSCVCWNNYIKNYLASTDYDGVVQMWDASTGQGFSQYTEHQKRAWSVDFSQADPMKFASASDDCSVKLWSINEKSSIGTIWNPANICCVQFSSFSPHLLVFGSADYKVYCYDLRHTKIPWCALAGHEKAVSYVKFLDSENIVSASTDNTLKLWDLNKTSSVGLSSGACSLTFSGHTNEKNFVGLSVLDGYITCGSETNEVYGYYRSLPMPITSHKFGSVDPLSRIETGDDNGQFVSSVCWRRNSNMVVAANSSGSMKLLQMV